MDSLSRLLGTFCLLIITLVSTAQMSLDNSYANAASNNNELTEDLEAPQTSLLRTHAGDFVYGPATRVKFKIIEEGSGVSTTYFKVGNYPYMKSDGRQMMPHDIEEGEHKMMYYSIDNEGNQEQIRFNKVFIDKSGPVVVTDLGSTPTGFVEGKPVFDKDVKLSVVVSDKMVDVQKVTYQINEGPVVTSENLTNIDLTEAITRETAKSIKVEIKAYDVFYNLTKQIVEFEVVR